MLDARESAYLALTVMTYSGLANSSVTSIANHGPASAYRSEIADIDQLSLLSTLLCGRAILRDLIQLRAIVVDIEEVPGH
jgi:hypothetical protein